MQVVLNKKEKEELVAKLYQDGKPIREMASAVHMSFGDIGKIIKSLDGKDDINLSDKSKTTQAMFLFKSGKKPIDLCMLANKIDYFITFYSLRLIRIQGGRCLHEVILLVLNGLIERSEQIIEKTHKVN